MSCSGALKLYDLAIIYKFNLRRHPGELYDLLRWVLLISRIVHRIFSVYNSFLERRSRDPEIRDPIKVFNLSGHACSEVSFFTSFLVMHADQKTRVRKSTRNIYTPRPECAPLQICRWRFVVRDYGLPDNGQKLRRWDEIMYAADSRQNLGLSTLLPLSRSMTSCAVFRIWRFATYKSFIFILESSLTSATFTI